jgi:hypothetical protein
VRIKTSLAIFTVISQYKITEGTILNFESSTKICIVMDLDWQALDADPDPAK